VTSVFVSAVPTVPPTTPAASTTPSDECDDDQANCHSGTGDDYDQTGANTRLQRLHPCLLHPAPFAMLISLEYTNTSRFSALNTPHFPQNHTYHTTHARNEVYGAWYANFLYASHIETKYCICQMCST